MESFGQLLAQYMRRVGISDAELARAIGVRRQTIFRWKEGLTARPSHREDVLRCADKLRLTSQERDEFLLAAGFAPEEPVSPLPATVEAEALTLKTRLPRWGLLVTTAVLVIVAVLIGWTLARKASERRQIAPVVPARPGETLVLVSHFANYSEGVGYNVAGRIREALQEEFEGEALADSRVDIWAQPLADRDEAVQMGQEYGATLVIWGEYDSGRVLANFTLPSEQEAVRTVRQVTTPADLSAVINTDLPTTARWVALVSVGQVQYAARRYEQALAAFERALNYPPGDERALAGAYFALGYIYGLQGDRDQAIAYYTRAIEQNPSLASAYSNRGVAYLEQGGESNLQRAISDFGQAIELVPTFAAPYFNRGLAYFALGEAYDQQSLADLRQAQTLQPDAPGPNNALCWELSLTGQPEDALPHCERAVATDSTARSRDSRGLTYTLLGRTAEAISDFEAFLAWLDTQPEDTQTRYGASRQAWIEALRSGSNPFDQETLRALRAE
jgi:tetratricopeptide (TPR) repeat protein/transcriptional regulator with XRE-family HTH domain